MASTWFVMEKFSCPECEGEGQDQYGRVCGFCFGQRQLFRDVPLQECAPWLEMEKRIAELTSGYKEGL